MHEDQINYINLVRHRYPHDFNSVKVLDVGSQDLNGNNRQFFINPDYTGLDIGAGKNVDVIGFVHEYANTCKTKYDVVISGEMLEHDCYWMQSIQAMYKLLKRGGLLIITCASTGRPEHGTSQSDATDSPFTNDYYRNVSKEDMEEAINGLRFESQELLINGTDLYFYGRKP